jgi:hypothetical protein
MKHLSHLIIYLAGRSILGTIIHPELVDEFIDWMIVEEYVIGILTV